MNITTMNIFAEAERLGAAFPWTRVDIWTERQPEGKYIFCAYVQSNYDLGADSVCAHGDTPAAAVDEAIKHASEHDPEIARQKKLRQLSEQIAKLEAAQFLLPPYKPGRLLQDHNGETAIKGPDTVDAV